MLHNCLTVRNLDAHQLLEVPERALPDVCNTVGYFFVLTDAGMTIFPEYSSS